MAEHPILFSAPMIRALLDGRKTQTRRVLTQRNTLIDGWSRSERGMRIGELDIAAAWTDPGPSPAGNPRPYLKVPRQRGGAVHRLYPRWQPGDRLWVREAWAANKIYDDLPPYVLSDEAVLYRADGHIDMRAHPRFEAGRNRSGIHMPRWMSRLTLVINEARIERVQDISAADAVAEGCPMPCDGMDPRGWYRALWDSLNAKRGHGWVANPWVIVLDFEVLPGGAHG